MTYVIVGASSGLGRAIAEVFAAAGHNLVIVSSDRRDLLALASDLTIRNGVRVVSVEADLGGEGDYLPRILTPRTNWVMSGVSCFLPGLTQARTR